MRKKRSKTAIMATLLSWALAFAMTTVGCPTPDDGGSDDPGKKPVVPTGLTGTWVNQTGTGTNSSFVVLEFTANQLKITDTTVATYFYTKDTAGKISIGTSASSINEEFCESYDITADVLTFTGGKSEDDYPSTNFYRVNTLTANQWKDGAITKDSQGQVWYSFIVTGGTTYNLWWNDDGSSSSGNGLKTLDVKVSGYYGSGTSIFTDTNTAWSTAQTITPNASQAGTVYVKVTPYSSSGTPTGTFAIAYNTSTPAARPNAPFTPPSAASLTANVWKDDEITADSNGAVWYRFNVSTGTPATVYNLWWNDDGGGNGMKTLDVKVNAYYSNGTSIFTGADSAWSTARTFTSPPLTGGAGTGTVYIKVMPYTSGSTGTFGITYNTGISTARPPVVFNPPNPIALTADEWKDGEITSATSPGNEVWYSLTVTSGTPYYFWWNEVGGYDGNRTKTLNISVSAFNSEGNVVSGFSNTDFAWDTAKSFTPTANQAGTLYLRVTPYQSASVRTGTYGIVYSETNARPPVPVNAVDPIELTADVWKRGDNTAAANGEVWYSFDVTSGTYRVWWNDVSNGDGRFSTLDVRASAWYASTGANIFYDQDNGWASAQSFTPTASDTVYVKVYPKNAGETGTFDILYSATVSQRPDVPFGADEPPNPIPLTAGQWEDGEITADSDGEVWYSIDITGGTIYVWWNEFLTTGGTGATGDGFKTLNIGGSAWYSNGASAFSDSSAWGTALYCYPPANAGDKIYIRIRPAAEGSTGTFGIVYNTTNTRPAVPFTPPENSIPLTVNQWANGEITTSSSGEAWYSIAVTGGTTYRIWLNDRSESSLSGATSAGDHTKTLDVYASGWYSDGAIALSACDFAWTSSQSVSFAPTAAGTVYIRVYPKTLGTTGTYGIVCNTATTRPPVPLIDPVPSNATALTANQWQEDGVITSDLGVWYSFPVTSGSTYRVWWNESGTSSYGDGTKTANVSVSAWYASGVNVLNGEESGWESYYIKPFTPTQNDTVYVRVYPNSRGNSGTFGIVYNDSNSTVMPPIPINPVSPTALTVNTWEDGELTSSIREAWYSITVTGGTTYRVWWNESDSNGNLTKTLDAYVSAYYADGTVIFRDEYSAWNTAQSFTPNASQAGTVYLKVAAGSSGSSTTLTGTFGIAFSTTNTRPAVSFPDATALTANTWEDGELTSSIREAWYSFDVTASTTYYIWWNDRWEGDDTKTLNIGVGICYNNGSVSSTNADSAWNYSQSITPPTGANKVYIKVSPYSGSTGVGTFSITYSATNTRPTVP